MWFTQIDLIRYLVVLRVNSTLTYEPYYPAPEFSYVLGNRIADRLPTAEARPWRKRLTEWEKLGFEKFPDHQLLRKLPEMPWPVEAVLMPYPDKQNFGDGELVFLEIKLFGADADHSLMLEVILPAIEDAGASSPGPAFYRNAVWGHFDVHGLFIAKGNHWDPIIRRGRLDLDYSATSRQWAEGLPAPRKKDRLSQAVEWRTPFDFQGFSALTSNKRKELPTLSTLLLSFLERMRLLLPGKYASVDDLLADIPSEERYALRRALSEAASVRNRKYEPLPNMKFHFDLGIGTQYFSKNIPTSSLPYLETASVVHIGNRTHYGCGTFTFL